MMLRSQERVQQGILRADLRSSSCSMEGWPEWARLEAGRLGEVISRAGQGYKEPNGKNKSYSDI